MSALAFHNGPSAIHASAGTIGRRTSTVHLNDRAHSRWLGQVASRLNELASMEGADPRGSHPMNPHDLDSALTFMQMVMRPDTTSPWIGLLNTGGLEVNWRGDDVEVEAVFDSARGDEMVYVTVGDNEWEAPADAAYSLFESVVDRLSASHLERSAAS